MVHKYKGKKITPDGSLMLKSSQACKKPRIVILTLIMEEAPSTVELWQTQDHYYHTRLEISSTVELSGRERGEESFIFPATDQGQGVKKNFLSQIQLQTPSALGWKLCTISQGFPHLGLRDTPGSWGFFCWVSCSAESLKAVDAGSSLFSSCSDSGTLKLLEPRGEWNGSDKAGQGL